MGPGMNVIPPKKKEAPKPAVDEKRENMKNALFSGISQAKKENSDTDESPKKEAPKEEPAGEINLLDFDMGGPTNTSLPEIQ